VYHRDACRWLGLGLLSVVDANGHTAQLRVHLHWRVDWCNHAVRCNIACTAYGVVIRSGPGRVRGGATFVVCFPCETLCRAYLRRQWCVVPPVEREREVKPNTIRSHSCVKPVRSFPDRTTGFGCDVVGPPMRGKLCYVGQVINGEADSESRLQSVTTGFDHSSKRKHIELRTLMGWSCFVAPPVVSCTVWLECYDQLRTVWIVCHYRMRLTCLAWIQTRPLYGGRIPCRSCALCDCDVCCTHSR
jgi:hypothetical protein